MSKFAREDDHIIKTLEEEGVIDGEIKKGIIDEITKNRELEQALEREELLDEELEVDKRLLFKCDKNDKKTIEEDLKEAHKNQEDIKHILKNEIKHRMNLENELKKEIQRRKLLESKLAKELSKRS